jgi:DNA-binding transcriptional regulator YiaG
VNLNDGPLESIRIQAVFIQRRKLLERDPPVDFAAVLTEIRRLTGWGTSDLCFILSVHRSTLHAWETRVGCIPNYEDGRAIVKLLETVRAR